MSDLFTPPGAVPHSASGPAAEGLEISSAAFPSEDQCPVCGLDPCGCGIDVPVLSDVEGLPIEDVIPIVEMDALGGADEAPAAELLPSWCSPAIAAFIDRRAAIEAKHGAKAVTDQGRQPGDLAKDLHERACALLDRLRGRAPDVERAELALNTLATIGALALALHERLAAIAATPD